MERASYDREAYSPKSAIVTPQRPENVGQCGPNVEAWHAVCSEALNVRDRSDRSVHTEAIAPIYVAPNHERYIRYLDAMAHYTRHSGAELRYAASLTPDAELASELRQLASEEAEHYLLARQDLEAFGRQPSAEPPPEVVDFRSYWNDVDSRRSFEHLGALYALENVAKHARPHAMGTLQSLELRAEQTRFVAVHLQADEDHGERIRRACARHAQHAAALLTGAERGAELWIAMHLAILETQR